MRAHLSNVAPEGNAYVFPPAIYITVIGKGDQSPTTKGLYGAIGAHYPPWGRKDCAMQHPMITNVAKYSPKTSVQYIRLYLAKAPEG